MRARVDLYIIRVFLVDVHNIDFRIRLHIAIVSEAAVIVST